MVDPLVEALRGLTVSVKTSLSVVHLRGVLPVVAVSARLQDFVVPTVTIRVPGRSDRTFRLPRYGLPYAGKPVKPPKKLNLSAVDRAVLLAAAGRTRVDMSVGTRRAAFDAAADMVKRRVSAAVSHAAAKKDFIRRFEAAARKPQRDQSIMQLARFFGVHTLLRESDVVECFRTVHRENIVKGILDS